MPRNLRDDFSMYYRGTYVTKMLEEGRAVMHVLDVSYNNSGYSASDIILHGPVNQCNSSGRVTPLQEDTWTADSIEAFHPHSGYYKLNNEAPVYVDFAIQNRTNRKGFESNKVLINGRPANITFSGIARLFANPQFNGKVFTDLCISRSKLLWRGEEIGSFHNGELTVEDGYLCLQEYVEKHINNFKSNRG